MSVGIVKIEASAALPVIERSLPAPWIAAECESRFPHPLQDRIELLVTDMKRVVMKIEILGIIEIERQCLIDAHWRKVSVRPFVRQSEDMGKRARRGILVMRRHDRVIQNDRHGSPQREARYQISNRKQDIQ